MSQSTTTPAERMADQLKEVMLTGDHHEALVLGAERGLIDPGIAAEDLADYDKRSRLLETSGAQAAWDADQEARSVPIDCPSWCKGLHGFVIGEDGHATSERDQTFTPFEQVTGHECTLAECEYLSVDLVREQEHPEATVPARAEFVFIETSGFGPLEVSADDLADVAAKITETLALASVRLAEIRARGE